MQKAHDHPCFFLLNAHRHGSGFHLLGVALRLLPCCVLLCLWIALGWSVVFSPCRKCALSGLPRTCKHRITLGDSGNYYYISPSCRARVSLPPAQGASALQNCSTPWGGGALMSALKLTEICGAWVCSQSCGGSWSEWLMQRFPDVSQALVLWVMLVQATCLQCVHFHGLIHYRNLVFIYLSFSFIKHHDFLLFKCWLLLLFWYGLLTQIVMRTHCPFL